MKRLKRKLLKNICTDFHQILLLKFEMKHHLINHADTRFLEL